jgi:hypothetical protein
MKILNAEQAAKLTPAELEQRQQEKAAERSALTATLKAASQEFVKTLPVDDDGVPYVKIRADAPGAWQAVMFWSQRLRDAGDLGGRVKYGHVAHAFELGYWKEVAK